jgi:S1-C subfamily serine protease
MVENNARPFSLNPQAALLFVTLIAAALAAAGGAHSADAPKVAEPPVIRVEHPEQARPLQFQGVVIKLRVGTVAGELQDGVFCTRVRDLVWHGDQSAVDDGEVRDVFRQELTAAGYRVVGDPDAVFEDESGSEAEYLVAGLIKQMRANVCHLRESAFNSEGWTGDAALSVEWQVYSRLERKVVYQHTTQGSAEITEWRATGDRDAVNEAFAQATRGLLADRAFHHLIAESDAPSKPAATEMTAFVARKAFTRPIAKNVKEIQRNVVVVFAGGGHGSGFVIDNVGHILTNEHVVRAAQRVKVRFESGQEETAAVLAADARRDVALLKIDRMGTGGLPIGFDPAAIGDTVYAVGAPLDPTYSATVSKGIVSGVREIDDETWIQSDVNVQHGSSGGPLLDDRGNVIGMTARGAPNEAGAPSGVNFFVPITDALKRLGLNPTRGTAG